MLKHGKSITVALIALLAVTVIAGCNPPPRPGYRSPAYYGPGYNAEAAAAKAEAAKAKEEAAAAKAELEAQKAK